MRSSVMPSRDLESDGSTPPLTAAEEEVVSGGGVAVSAIFLGLFLAGGLLAHGYGYFEAGVPGAGFFPMLACGVGAVCSAVVLASGAFDWWRNRRQSVAASSESAKSSGDGQIRRETVVSVVVLAYPLLIGTMGLTLSLFVLLAVLSRLALSLSGWRLLAVSAFPAAFTWLVFAELLHVPFPPSVFGF